MAPRHNGPASIDIHVGARVRQQRMQRGISRTALADAVGLDGDQMAMAEKGEKRFLPETLNDVARELGVSVSALMGDFEVSFPALPATAPDDGSLPSSDDVQRLVDAFVSVRSPEFREALMRHAEAGALAGSLTSSK